MVCVFEQKKKELRSHDVMTMMEEPPRHINAMKREKITPRENLFVPFWLTLIGRIRSMLFQCCCLRKTRFSTDRVCFYTHLFFLLFFRGAELCRCGTEKERKCFRLILYFIPHTFFFCAQHTRMMLSKKKAENNDVVPMRERASARETTSVEIVDWGKEVV